MAKAKPGKPHVVEELENQFHDLQKKLAKARDSYVAGHEKELSSARKKLKSLQMQLKKAREQAAKAAVQAKKSGTKTAKNQLKKARAVSLLLGNSLKETKDILVTAESKLHAAKPFDRKLAARAKVLAQFEKDWDRKMKAETEAKAKRAKLALAKRRAAKRKPSLPVPVASSAPNTSPAASVQPVSATSAAKPADSNS